MYAALGLAAAAAWATGDFLAGMVGRRQDEDRTIGITLSVLITATAVLLIVAPSVSPITGLSWADARAGMLAGVAGAVSLGALYRGLAIGRMGIVAPVAGAVGAVVPVVVGVLAGQPPSVLQAVGIVVTVAAVAVVSWRSDTDRSSGDGDMLRGLGMAVLAGLGFGTMLVMLGRVGPSSGVWPLAVMKASEAAALATVGLLRTRRIHRPAGWNLTLLASGAANGGAVLAYLFAVQHGLLALVGVLASLYPAGTALLAWGVLDERLRPRRVAALLAAGIGVTLMTVA